MEMLKLKNKIEFAVLNEPEIRDFALARNKILEHSKSDWIFFIDSDEIIPKKLYEELKSLNLGGYTGFYVWRDNYFLGRFIGRDKILRLGRRGFGSWYRKVHEEWGLKGRKGELKNHIFHETAKSLKEYIYKLNLYSTLHAEANTLEGKKANLFKIIFYPKIKFFQSVIGGRGVVFSILQSFHSFLSWSKLWLSQKK